MSNKVPDKVARAVKERVYELANECNYLALGRTKSGQFMNRLVEAPEVGGRLGEFMKRSEVRTYIKDAVLNRYSKDKTAEERPQDFKPIILREFGLKTKEIADMGKGVSLFKQCDEQPNRRYVIVAEGTFLKWETALRKALLCVGNLPVAEEQNTDIHILLCLFAQYKRITSADKKLIRKALWHSRATTHIFGESN